MFENRSFQAPESEYPAGSVILGIAAVAERPVVHGTNDPSSVQVTYIPIRSTYASKISCPTTPELQMPNFGTFPPVVTILSVDLLGDLQVLNETCRKVVHPTVHPNFLLSRFLHKPLQTSGQVVHLQPDILPYGKLYCLIGIVGEQAFI